ncbi:hypothetical protein SAMN05216382_3075 [Sphingomonas palmae]|uniref:Uncharacterized protein n=1 Tax=Sphingomonas palmae TaxID=1855283 RepID=A0A1H7UV54_9SPHN|nr:hypothetical protein [Sphingomonas palmae]SEM00565.1 hypothetical protein SAMN05216382_3075 [Sphingomonas palmae]
MTAWRILWDQIWPDEEPDVQVAASMDEIAAVCAPSQDDPFLVIAMYQHRNGQVLKMSIDEWLNTHGEAMRDHLHHATDAASRLHAAARTAAQATAALDELGDRLAGRVQQAIARVDHAERDLRTQAAESNAAWRLIREQLSWTRPALLTLLTIALLASLIVSAFLARQAFAERPGDALWAQLSDNERRDLPGFISSGSLDAVMSCRIPGFEIRKDHCVRSQTTVPDDNEGWLLPEQTVARSAHRWSAEAR